jgi:integrase
MARQRKLPAGMQLRGKVYYSCFRANGRQVRKRLSTDFEAACRILNSLRAKADQADFGLLDNDVALAELRKKFERHCRLTLRPKTQERYEHALDKLLSLIPVTKVSQLSEAVVNNYREQRLAEVSPRSVNIEVIVLNTMLNWASAKRNELIASNPVAGVKPLTTAGNERKRRRSLTVDEIHAIFDASPEYLRPVWRMLLTTGMRHAEVTSLRFANVDFDRGMVTVSAENAKSKKAREIPLDEEVLATIKRLSDEAPHRRPGKGATPQSRVAIPKYFSHEHVFVSPDGTPWRGTLLRRFYTACKRAGIQDARSRGSVDIHSLRVSFATLALENGAAPKQVQEILGHATLAMTMNVYGKATDSGKRAAINALPFAKATQPTHLIPMHNEHGMHANRFAASEDKAQVTAEFAVAQ